MSSSERSSLTSRIHVNLASPINNLEAIDATGAPVGGFGQINTLQVPNREIQFGLKLSW